MKIGNKLCSHVSIIVFPSNPISSFPFFFSAAVVNFSILRKKAKYRIIESKILPHSKSFTSEKVVLVRETLFFFCIFLHRKKKKRIPLEIAVSLSSAMGQLDKRAGQI